MEKRDLAPVIIGTGHIGHIGLGVACAVMHSVIILATPVIHNNVAESFEKSVFQNDDVVFLRNDFANKLKIMTPSLDATIFRQKSPKVFLENDNRLMQVYARKQAHFSHSSRIYFVGKQNRYPTGFT